MSGDKIIVHEYHSPFGALTLGSFADKLCLCDWKKNLHPDRTIRRVERLLNAECRNGITDVIEEAETQISEYFDNKRQTFTIPLLTCGTPFQEKVWQHICFIPYGRITTYGELAKMIGNPTSVRAVANAVGANAISIFIPCHRIIGANLSPGGYAGGQTAKLGLIALEDDND